MRIFRGWLQKLAGYIRPRKDDIEQREIDAIARNAVAVNVFTRMFREVGCDSDYSLHLARRLARELKYRNA